MYNREPIFSDLAQAQIAAMGYEWVGVHLIGTVSAGVVQVMGTLDGVNYAQLRTIDTSTESPPGNGAAGNDINAAGIYRVRCSGLQKVILQVSNDYAGTLKAILSASGVS